MGDRNSDGLRVLVVDDDDLSRELAGKIFEHEKADVVLAATASDALRELRMRPGVDVLSVDISLDGDGGDREGAELAQRIRADQPDLPIIGYSSYFSEHELSEDERAAFTGYFPRGGSTRDIESWVARCLDEAVRYRESRRVALYQQLVDAADRTTNSDHGAEVSTGSDQSAPLGPDLSRLLDATSTPQAAEYLTTAGTRLEQSAAAGLQALSESVRLPASDQLQQPRVPNLQNLAVGLVHLEFRLDELARKLDVASSQSGVRRHLDDTTKVVAVIGGLVAAVVGIVKLFGG